MRADNRLSRSRRVPPGAVFVDESKRTGLIMVAVRVENDQLAKSRSALRQLLLPQQTHLHFTRESDRRRRSIVAALSELPLSATAYIASPGSSGRARCLERIVEDCMSQRVQRLVLEEDASLRRADLSTLYAAVRMAGLDGGLVYAHARKREEPMLWSADALAWCWTHRPWRALIADLVTNEIDLRD